MKQIFDWMREECDSESYKACEVLKDERVVTVFDLIHLIDEAEAKWEADCCIRVIGKPFTSSCGQKYDKWLYVGESYCSKCGKPIKISEVE